MPAIIHSDDPADHRPDVLFQTTNIYCPRCSNPISTDRDGYAYCSTCVNWRSVMVHITALGRQNPRKGWKS